MKACKHCATEMTQRYAANGAKRGWTCPACNRDRVRAYYADNPEKRRDVRLWTHYRMRAEDFTALLANQGGCAACGETSTTEWHVDHDHECCDTQRTCGRCVRGILCEGCNVTLGHAAENPVRLRALADYLERAHGRS